MRIILFFILASLVFGYSACNSKPDATARTLNPTRDTLPKTVTQKSKEENSNNSHEIPNFDSIPSNYFPDNNQLRKKRQEILSNFRNDIFSSGAIYDTLVDLNYDQHRDYVLGYYGSAGTGLKHLVAVYLYSKNRGKYILNSKLSDLVNPGFFIRDKKITSFYIGHGGGYGQQLEWMNGMWTLTKTFNVDNNGDSTLWELFYPLTGKKEKILLPFRMIPPEQILETNRKF